MIPLATPNLIGNEETYLKEAIARAYVGPGGPFVERFEEMVARASGRRWAVATINGTAAIQAAAEVLGFRGHVVLVPKYAFPAARNVFRSMGCIVGENRTDDGANHDSCNYVGPIRELIDRAPAIGEWWQGSIETSVECYSFAANKIVTCGHGGAVVGDHPWLENAVREVIHQGRDRGGLYNFRMADINAALGCAQMERLEDLKAAKRAIWDRYASSGIPMMERGPSRWMATTTKKIDIAKLREAGIEAREECGGTSLPCSTHLTVKCQDDVIRCVASLS